MAQPSAGPYQGSSVEQASDAAGTLGDVFDRILDKGLVIVGDIKVNLLDIELLTIKLRLLIASVDTAKQMGIDWWEHDPALTSDGRKLLDENRRLRERVEALEPGRVDASEDEPDVGS